MRKEGRCSLQARTSCSGSASASLRHGVESQPGERASKTVAGVSHRMIRAQEKPGNSLTRESGPFTAVLTHRDVTIMPVLSKTGPGLHERLVAAQPCTRTL